MASDSESPGEGTVTTLKKFVQICLKRGKTLEEARDALLVANLERRLVESALEASVFDSTTEGNISLDYSKAKGRTTSFTPPKKRAVAKIRRTPAFEKVELASTPFFRHGMGRRRQRPHVSGRPERLSTRFLRWALRWGFVTAALVGLVIASTRTTTVQSDPKAIRITQHSRTQFAPSSTTRAPTRELARTTGKIRSMKTRSTQ
jgi:hypothetical protein